jgi:hypothetical protein
MIGRKQRQASHGKKISRRTTTPMRMRMRVRIIDPLSPASGHEVKSEAIARMSRRYSGHCF